MNIDIHLNHALISDSPSLTAWYQLSSGNLPTSDKLSM